MTGWRIWLGRAVASLVVALLAPLPVHAQDPNSAEARQPVLEEVVVVGSLIRRRIVYEGRAPVQTLDATLFESVGAAQPVDVLASLTANTGSYLATQQNYLQGVSQFSLRGVGLSSTLTLINGRRAGFAPVSNDVGQSFFDINTLPVLLIERVEILRDGASATYGSQAVAGVANVVTRQGFTGLEVAGGRSGREQPRLRPGFRFRIRDGERSVQFFRCVARTGRKFPHGIRLDDPSRHRPGRRRRHRGRVVRLGTGLAGKFPPRRRQSRRDVLAVSAGRFRHAPLPRIRIAVPAAAIRADRCAGWTSPTRGR